MRSKVRGRRIAVIVLLVLVQGATVRAAESNAPGLGSMLQSDFKYLVDNVQLDAQDIATAPRYSFSENSVLRSPRFYLTLLGVGALWGGAFALDPTMRAHLHHMSSSDADLLQNISYGSIGATAAVMYGYGFVGDNARMRQDTLTGGEGAGIATLFDLAVKAGFGRLRPYQDNHSHTKFFHGGESFVSGDVTPMFGLATGISKYFNNEWYVAAPAYSLALLDGFGRMGHDAHWFSDVVGAGLLGWGTTELFFYLHKQHENQPSRWRIFPLSEAPATAAADQTMDLPTGIGVEYRW